MRPVHAPLFVIVAALTLCACAGAKPNPQASAPQELMADMHLRNGRPDAALVGYDRVLRASPDQPRLALKRARALLRLGRAAEALAGFDSALAAMPAGSAERGAATQGRGEALLALKRSEEARAALEQALELEPDSWRARCLLGMSLQGLARHAEAAEQYRAALASPRLAQLAEGPRRAAREELANNLGVALVLAGDLEGGVVIFRKAMSRGLGSERVCNNLGLLLVRLGRPAEALDAFRAVGDEARALNNLGWALLVRGENVRARTLFERALEAAPAQYDTAEENLRRAMQGVPTPAPATPAAPVIRVEATPSAAAIAEPVRFSWPERDGGARFAGIVGDGAATGH